MFAVPLFLFLFASHVHHAVNGLPSNILMLPQANETFNSLDFTNDTLAPNISTLLTNGYTYQIPGSGMEIHITTSKKARTLPDRTTFQCLQNFIQQFGLFRPEQFIDRLRYGVYDNVQATLSPSKSPDSLLTYRSGCKVLGGLWNYIYSQKLMYELRFAVFEKGLMIAWGLLELRDEPIAPSTPPKHPPAPTAVE